MKGLIPRQPFHQRGMSNPVMAADQKGLQGAGLPLNHRWMFRQFAESPQGGRADPQQSAHFTGAIDRLPK
ncbi:MAG: hypothetical protein IPL59_24375 [Candidatus Competibacteraceae bacterium]|nr:hypothetical protein [Candidatus Competibacteraceae bacterium]